MLGAVLIFAIPVAVLILVALNLSSVIQEDPGYTYYLVGCETFEKPEYWCDGSGIWDAGTKNYGEFPSGTCYMWATCADDGWGADAYVRMRSHFTPEETFSADKIGLTVKGFEYFLNRSAMVAIGVFIETVDGNLVAQSPRRGVSLSDGSGFTPVKYAAQTFCRDLSWNYPQHYEFTEGVTYYVIVELSVSSSKGGSVSMESYNTDRGTEQGIALSDILLREC